MSEFAIALGVVVKDRLTGFKGRTTGRVQYITGCSQYAVQPDAKESGEFVEARYFDEHRLEVIDARPIVLGEPVAAEPARRFGPDLAAPIK